MDSRWDVRHTFPEDLPRPREGIQRYQNWRLPHKMVYWPLSSKPKTTQLCLWLKRSPFWIGGWGLLPSIVHSRKHLNELLTLPLRWDVPVEKPLAQASTDPWPHWSHYACRTDVLQCRQHVYCSWPSGYPQGLSLLFSKNFHSNYLHLFTLIPQP